MYSQDMDLPTGCMKNGDSQNYRKNEFITFSHRDKDDLYIIGNQFKGHHMINLRPSSLGVIWRWPNVGPFILF